MRTSLHHHWHQLLSFARSPRLINSRLSARQISPMVSSPAEWTRVIKDSGGIPPYSVYKNPIEKSAQDDREYRIVKLENGFEAVVIHDAKADKAAASLDVSVGHLYDPDDMPGLAHFCEHLLFMGTEQFPKENEYSEYLAKNNGSSNAYTSTSNTNYFFSVSTTALTGALSRFASFFHSPLFSPSCTSRELNAVDSEHKKNHQNDIWRIFQLNKELSREGHVWRKFGSGNRESLSRAAREMKTQEKLNASRSGSLAPSPIASRSGSPAPSVASVNSETDADGGAVGREIRRRLVEWWSKEYCASRMRLCVIGNDSLDELADLVSTLFSPILNRGQDPLPTISEHPFGPNEMGTIVSVQTIMSIHVVEISFPLKYQPPLWRHKPASFLGHFVGHEGPGSLHSYLKKKGWITSLSVGAQNLARGFAMFKATHHLTKDGFKNHRAVILATFKYLSLLRSSSFPSWYQQEIATISSTRFRFQEKRRPEDYAVWVSEHMSWPVPRDRLISGPHMTWPWEEGGKEGGGEKEVRDILNTLRIGAGRSVLMARAEEHESVNGKGEWQKEPWYGTEYKVVRYDEEFIKEAEGPNDIPELFLPGPNKFIPTNLDVDKREVIEPLKRPHLIRETPLSTLWHKKDDRFWVPKAHVIVDIRSPVANVSPRASVLTHLYADLVNDTLTEFAYDADLAGLSYALAANSAGVWISLAGYNDKMDVLARQILQSAKELVVDPGRLEVMKQELKRDWENFFLGQPYQVSDYFGKHLLSYKQWNLAEKLSELPSVTVEEVQNHAMQMLEKVHMRMLITGNIYKDEAINIAEMAEKILGSSALSSDVEDRALILPKASNFIWSTSVPNPNEPNSCLNYYVHIGPHTSQSLRVTAAFLIHLVTEPTFNVLRTQEQLGYIVSCSPLVLHGSGHSGMRIIVQSERGPKYLEERVDAFLDKMKETIEDMPHELFEEQRAGLERKWREAPKNLAEDTNRHWKRIDDGHLDFLRRENDANELKNVTKRDILDLFDSCVHPSSSTRSKLAVHMRSLKPRPKKVSGAASQAFEALARAAGVVVLDEDGWKDILNTDKPALPDFVKYWYGVLIDGGLTADAAKGLLAKMPLLVGQYPAEGDDDDGLREGATYIEDVKAFQASLEVSEPARPLVEWADLPVSKF